MVAVDRATLVLFTMDAREFAVPVELVERILRPDALSDQEHVTFGGRSVRLIDLRRALDRSPVAPRTAVHRGERVIVFTVQGTWIAARVDRVLEVATIDASLIHAIPGDALTTLPPGARGRFSRQDNPVVVLDMVRVLRALFDRERAEQTAVAAEPT
jgi:chemotaxis signal transduction protein